MLTKYEDQRLAGQTGTVNPASMTSSALPQSYAPPINHHVYGNNSSSNNTTANSSTGSYQPTQNHYYQRPNSANTTIATSGGIAAMNSNNSSINSTAFHSINQASSTTGTSTSLTTATGIAVTTAAVTTTPTPSVNTSSNRDTNSSVVMPPYYLIGQLEKQYGVHENNDEFLERTIDFTMEPYASVLQRIMKTIRAQYRFLREPYQKDEIFLELILFGAVECFVDHLAHVCNSKPASNSKPEMEEADATAPIAASTQVPSANGSTNTNEKKLTATSPAGKGKRGKAPPAIEKPKKVKLDPQAIPRVDIVTDVEYPSHLRKRKHRVEYVVKCDLDLPLLVVSKPKDDYSYSEAKFRTVHFTQLIEFVGYFKQYHVEVPKYLILPYSTFGMSVFGRRWLFSRYYCEPNSRQWKIVHSSVVELPLNVDHLEEAIQNLLQKILSILERAFDYMKERHQNSSTTAPTQSVGSGLANSMPVTGSAIANPSAGNNGVYGHLTTTPNRSYVNSAMQQTPQQSNPPAASIISKPVPTEDPQGSQATHTSLSHVGVIGKRILE